MKDYSVNNALRNSIFNSDYGIFAIGDLLKAPPGSSDTKIATENYMMKEISIAANAVSLASMRDFVVCATKSVKIERIKIPRDRVAFLDFNNALQGGDKFIFFEDFDSLETSLVDKLRLWTSSSSSEISIPIQRPEALVFGGDNGEPIKLIEPLGSELNLSDDQRETYQDIREKAEQLLDQCKSSNSLVLLESPLTKLLEAMGPSLENLRVRAFWSPMNTLRHRVEADIRSREISDVEEPPLPSLVSADLGNLVETLNVFCAFEPKLLAIDDLRSDPEDRSPNSDASTAARKMISGAYELREAIAPSTLSALNAVLLDSSDASPSTRRANLFALGTARNLALELLGRGKSLFKSELPFASKELRSGAYKASGAIIGTAIVTGALGYGAIILRFISNYESVIRTLLGTLGKNPGLDHLINLLTHL